MISNREPLMQMLRRIIQYSISDGVPFRSGCVALVVGTILNLINQGDAILEATPLNWIKIILTYFGPMPSVRMVLTITVSACSSPAFTEAPHGGSRIQSTSRSIFNWYEQRNNNMTVTKSLFAGLAASHKRWTK